MSTENATQQVAETTTTTSSQAEAIGSQGNTSSASAQAASATGDGSGEVSRGVTEGVGADGQASGQVAGEVKTYTPNFKFKVMDEEREFDELFRGLIKDQDTEKKVREFHEKAYGLDYQKPKYERLKTEHTELSQKYQNIDTSLKQLSSYVREGDLGAFFEAINVPKEMVFQFVKQELNKLTAPPEQRAQLEEFERIRRENLALKQQTEMLSSQYENESLQAKVIELDTTLASPDVVQIAEFVDSKRGKGTFKDFVIRTGLHVYNTTGKQIPVAEAVREAIAYWQPFVQGGIQPGTAAGDVAGQATGSQAQPKPTMPNVSGRSTSPIRQGPRSLDDLKKLAQTMGA